MVRTIAALGVAVLLVGCGQGSSDHQKTSAAGGAAAEQEVLDAMGAKAAPVSGSLELCDGTPVKVLTVNGADAVSAWHKLRDQTSTTGLWPVLVGSSDELDLLAQTVRFNCKAGDSFKRTLKDASSIDVGNALSKVARAYGVTKRDLAGTAPLPPSPEPKDTFFVPLDLVTLKPLPKVVIALLPIREGWQATAILPWGNYNDNPGPAVHTAVLHEWNRRFGAEPVSLNGDTIEVYVPHPPTTEPSALALAKEQYEYSPDIVQQGLGNVGRLASAIENAHAWYFWWD